MTINEEKMEETLNEEASEEMAEEMPEAEGPCEEQDCPEEEAEETEAETEEAAEETSGEEDEELQTKYLRLMADFQNFKRRTEKDKSDIYARANESIVTELLTVADNFERALSEENTADENFVKGMQLIFDQFNGVLQKFGVAEIEAEGVEFDPNFHNAVMMEDTDKVESGQVSEVLQKGYTLNGRVIRPSMVKVAN